MTYRKPPIVEAVIGVRFDPPLAADNLNEVILAFQKGYPAREDQQDISFRLEPGRVDISAQPHGAKLTALDGSSVVIVASNEFATLRVAPYPGWESLATDAVANFKKFRSVAGFRKITHLGVRFVNRIDIPVSPGQLVPVSQYLLIAPSLPETFCGPQIENYFYVLQMRWSDRVRLNVQTGSAGEALIGHASFLLDIDAIWATELPQSVEAISSALTELRQAKNEIFEACVSDSARALFEVKPL